MQVFNSVLITFTFILQLQQILTETVASQPQFIAPDSLFILKEVSSAPLFHTASDNRHTLKDINNNSIKIINAHKCCPSGHIMGEQDTCQPLKLREHSSDVDGIISQSLNNYFLRSHKIVSNLIPNNLSSSCELIRFASMDVTFEGDAKNELSFSIRYHLKNYWDFKIKPKPFCVDLLLFRDEKGVSYVPQIYYCTTKETHFHVPIHYPILLCISAASLIVTFIIYFFVPISGSAKLITSDFGAGSRKTMATLLTGRILLCHIFTLSLTFICLAIVQREHFAPTETSCVAAGYVTYGASIASFAWLTVCCFDYYRILISFKISNKMLFIRYSIFGWGVPILAVTAATVTQFQSTDLGISDTVNPNIGLLSCWFPAGGISALVFFYAPVSTLILLNIIFFLSLIFNPNFMHCWKRKKGLAIPSNRKDFQMALQLFFITGVPWVFELAAVLSVHLSVTPAFSESIKYVFEIVNLLNSLRGVIIFIIFVILQRDVRHFLMLRLKKICNKDITSKNITREPSFSTQQSNYRLTLTSYSSEVPLENI